MSDVPDPWGQYGCLQTKLLRKTQVDDHAWGLEAALFRLLIAVESSTNDDALERTVASRARRERNRLRLLRIHVDREESHRSESEAALDAKRRLRAIRARVGFEDWRLLRAVAAGYEYSELSGVFHAAPGTLRARVLRIRRRIGDLAVLPQTVTAVVPKKATVFVESAA
jgi:hypothetical protein